MSKKKADNIGTEEYDTMHKDPLCPYNAGVCCALERRVCHKCGFNPPVDEMRQAAIRLGEKRFLRYSLRDFGNYETMLAELHNSNADI